MVFVPAVERPAGGLCTQWATVADVCAPCDGLELPLLDRWLEVASSNLYELTGRRWPGQCTETFYPEATADCGPPLFYPVASGECVPAALLRRAGVPGRRARGLPEALRLPGYPVTGIEAVVIEGETQSDLLYRVEDGRWLVFTADSTVSDRQGWPTSGEWYVTYNYGHLPPPGGREAAAALGCEYAKACTPALAGECRLPKRVQSITRQGVSMAILDPLTLFNDGLTGIPEVDSWVAFQRLGAARRPAGLLIPGRRSAGHRRTVEVDTIILDGGNAAT